MLGIAALAQLALAEFPQTGGGGSPAWRRLLAQTYPGATLNRVPDAELVSGIVHRMLMEGELLYRQEQLIPLKIDRASSEEDDDLIAILMASYD